MIKQTVEVMDFHGSKQLVMNGKMFNEIMLAKDDGKPTIRLTMTADAFDMLKEAMTKGKSEWTSKTKEEPKKEASEKPEPKKEASEKPEPKKEASEKPEPKKEASEKK